MNKIEEYINIKKINRNIDRIQYYEHLDYYNINYDKTNNFKDEIEITMKELVLKKSFCNFDLNKDIINHILSNKYEELNINYYNFSSIEKEKEKESIIFDIKDRINSFYYHMIHTPNRLIINHHNYYLFLYEHRPLQLPFNILLNEYVGDKMIYYYTSDYEGLQLFKNQDKYCIDCIGKPTNYIGIINLNLDIKKIREKKLKKILYY